MTPLLVIPFCPKDHHLVLLNLKLLSHFTESPRFDCLLSYESTVKESDVRAIRDLAEENFLTVHELRYSPWTGNQSWPVPQNRAWQTTARHIEATYADKYPGWFWWESDAVPLKPNWFHVLSRQYIQSKKWFAGFRVEIPGIHPYQNGVGFWPSRISNHLGNSGALFASRVGFDQVAGKEVMRSFHPLNGLQEHIMKSKGGEGGQSFTQSSFDEWTTAHPQVVFVHGVTDGSLHEILMKVEPESLRAEREEFAKLLPVPTTGVPTRTPQHTVDLSISKPPVSDRIFYSSGDFGDIIYALPLIRALGGGEIHLGPDNPHRLHQRGRMTAQSASVIAPVLKHQSYISDVLYAAHIPDGDHVIDLNAFRTVYHDPYIPWQTLPEVYFRWHKTKPDLSPWLSPVRCDFPPFKNKIIVNRTSRYQNPHFPWESIVWHLIDELLFIGTDDEYNDFTSNFGMVNRIKIENLFEAYSWISSCRLFIGNQSCLRAMAEGLGVPVLMEGSLGYADCDFKRDGVFNVYHGSDTSALVIWLQRLYPNFNLLSRSTRLVC